MKKFEQALVGLAGALALVQSAHAQPAPPVSPTPVVDYEYDAMGRPTKVTQAKGVAGFSLATTNTYDGLGRMKSSIDPATARTEFGYDPLDRLASVKDPRSLVTQYPRNGLGDVRQLISPDTGTANHTYDVAGNLATRTDSRGVLSTYSYDELNRLKSVVHSKSGSTSQTYGWTYDQTGAGFSNGIGRLTSSTHPAGSAQYAYDPFGRLLVDTQRVNAATGANAATVTATVSYGYDVAGRVNSITYPSGRKLSLTYTGGALSAISLAPTPTGTASPLITGIQWEPFGAARSWTWNLASGTQAHQRVFDTSGRLVRYRLGPNLRDITYDAADRITSYKHYAVAGGAAQPTLDQSFGYDAAGRLTTITTAGASWTITYDPSGNRTGVTLNGSASTYTTEATSNRLASTGNPARSFSYDQAGNTTGSTAVNPYTAIYDLAGRMATLTKSGVTSTYSIDGNGRRVRKFSSTGAASTVIFVYDQAGQILGEYDSTGKAIREYVWMGSTPIAVFTPDTAAPVGNPIVYTIHTDHLDTPRVVLDKNGAIRWRWLAEPFGTTAPETNPANLGAFTFNLRFPGQYSDSESGLAYNAHRDYDSTIGRYAESDPISLDGGINTYTYVDGRPTNSTDPSGLYDPTNFQSTTKISLGSSSAPPRSVPRIPTPNPWVVFATLMCMPSNVGQEAACSDDPRLERPECRKCQNNNHPDLYRSGNAQGPKIGPENMRPEKEVTGGGAAIPGLGASTFESIKGSGRWWKLPASVIVPPTLCLRHTHGDHWQLEPASATTLSQYAAALGSTRPFWVDMGNIK